MFIAIWLVVWNMNFIVPFSWELTFIPTDEVICFRGIGILPTRLVYLWYIYHIWLWWIRLWWIILWWIILWWIYDIYISLYIYIYSISTVYVLAPQWSVICGLGSLKIATRIERSNLSNDSILASLTANNDQTPTVIYIYMYYIYILYI